MGQDDNLDHYPAADVLCLPSFTELPEARRQELGRAGRQRVLEKTPSGAERRAATRADPPPAPVG